MIMYHYRLMKVSNSGLVDLSTLTIQSLSQYLDPIQKIESSINLQRYLQIMPLILLWFIDNMLQSAT